MIQSMQSFEVRGSPEVHNVDAVLRETLEKLRAAAPKRCKDLRDECTVELERLDNSVIGGVNADEFFKALKLACEAQGNPKVVSIALDSVQKLMAYGFLTGKGADPFKEATPGMPRCLMDSVIECVCNCAEQMDDTVQLQMIRSLLTAVTSQTCEVHGNSLILAVTTCFKIHRDSKSNMNQRTAQGSLTQMLNVVTQRMEISSVEMSTRAVSIEDSLDNTRSRQAAKLASSDLASLPPAKLLNDWMSSYLTRLVDEVVLEKCKVVGSSPMLLGADLAPPGKFGWCVVCRNSAAHYCVDTKDPICGHACKYRNLERISLVETHFGPHREEEATGPVVDTVPEAEQAHLASPEPAVSEGASRLESNASPVISDEAQSESLSEHGDKALNPYHRDALNVFQWLCKLSMKDLPPGQADSRLVRQKRMALDLVLIMLQNCGPVFRSSDQFIAVLQKLLCISLVKNSVSSIPKIFSLSLQIFVMLITNFKEHLRMEIGVFIEQIFLRILESGNSTYHHKYRVLQVFYKLCTDASTALELFLNFDCDVDEKNIFERMIECLTKIAQGKYTSVEHANLIQPHQEQELKLLALQALVTLMGSIVDWARRMTEDQRVSRIEDGHAQESKPDADSDGEDDSQSEPTPSNTGGPHMVPSSIVSQKQRKLELQIGVNKFNMKPKRGIEYLKQNGFVTDDPRAIAELFMNPDIGLDKTAIGDYLGEDKPFNKSILYALADMHDFRDLELDVCLRNFLSIFRLPGEAQKIDRMMEKFAEKYCNDNPGKFANADCAFVLSFALIMLQTDLHNPGIKNKMTKDQFVSNNRGINDDGDLPREYLEKLYDAIANNPMSLKEDEDMRSRMDSQTAQGASQKFELFVRETESIVQKSQEMMKQKVLKHKSTSYIAAQSVEHVRPLFQVACWPYLATLAVLLEMQDSQTSVELCIEGFKHCIRIAARFDMDTERDAFVSSLAKFTYLITIKEMKQKNIECIKALFAIGLSEGNNLGPSWQFVLHCISQLERLHLIGSRSREDFQFFQGEEEGVSSSPAVLTQRSSSVSTLGNQVIKRRAHGLGVSALVSLGTDDRQVELVNSESVIAQIDSAQIELLFNRSTSLGSNAIVHFVTQLARVSVEELALADQPRIFSLQKLVEVADYNMGRIRLVWSRIWRVLSRHFVEVAKHSNIRICMYGIDSLRQLAMKFLEKDELSNYNFQAEFLRPFEVVMSTPGVSKEVKDLVVTIISNMVHMRINNIKSGWKTVFHILYAAAQEHGSEAITQCAFACIEKVIELSYHLFIENLADGVRSLLAFGMCKANIQISLKAIAYLLQAAEYLADKTKPDPPPPPVSSLAGVSGTAAEVVAEAGPSHPAAHWFPILRGLSMLVSDPRRDVRAAALNGVFDCLRDHGGAVFDEDTWRMVFNGVIKPLFDDIHHQLHNGDQRKPDGSAADVRSEGTAASWAASMGPPTCLHALTALVRLFESNLASLSFLLDDVLRLIENCIQHDTEAVARIGVEGFKQLLLQTGGSLDAESWDKVTPRILKLFNDSMPTELMCVEANAAGEGQLPFRKEAVVNKCVVQLLLIDMLQECVEQHYEHICTGGVMTLLDALQRSFEFAQEFNQQIELRQMLKRLGFMREMRQLPGLLKQEREALSCSLKVLFRVQGDARARGSEHALLAMRRLLRLCATVLRNYISKEKLLQEFTDTRHVQEPSSDRDREATAVEIEREILGLVPIISEVVLRGLKDLHSDQFAQHASVLFPLLSELAVVNSREIRLMVRDVLLEKVAPLLCVPSKLPGDAGVALPPPCHGGAQCPVDDSANASTEVLSEAVG